MCRCHVVRIGRKYRNLLPRNLWPSINTDIHTLQLSFSDDVLNHDVKLLLQKWNANPLIKNFSEYFVDQLIEKSP